MKWTFGMLALSGLLAAGAALAAPPSGYQGGAEKKDEAVKTSQTTGVPEKEAKADDKKDGKKKDGKPEEKKGSMTASTFAGLELRNIGPATVGGRIVDLAVDPRTPTTWYVAAAAGGVWKTTDATASSPTSTSSRRARS